MNVLHAPSKPLFGLLPILLHSSECDGTHIISSIHLSPFCHPLSPTSLPSLSLPFFCSTLSLSSLPSASLLCWAQHAHALSPPAGSLLLPSSFPPSTSPYTMPDFMYIAVHNIINCRASKPFNILIAANVTCPRRSSLALLLLQLSPLQGNQTFQ